MKTIIAAGAFALALTLFAPVAARAALPDAAYAGPLGERLAGGASCVVHTVHNPDLIVRPNVTDRAFGATHLHAGQYVYWDNVAKRCVTGGAVNGIQF